MALETTTSALSWNCSDVYRLESGYHFPIMMEVVTLLFSIKLLASLRQMNLQVLSLQRSLGMLWGCGQEEVYSHLDEVFNILLKMVLINTRYEFQTDFLWLIWNRKIPDHCVLRSAQPCHFPAKKTCMLIHTEHLDMNWRLTYAQVGASGNGNTLRYCGFLTVTQALVCATDTVRWRLPGGPLSGIEAGRKDMKHTSTLTEVSQKESSDHWCTRRIPTSDSLCDKG